MKYNRHPFLACVTAFVAVSLITLSLAVTPALGGDQRDYLKEACEIHLAEAETRAKEAIRRRARATSAFVYRRASGARAAAEDLTGWYALWRATWGLRDRDSHEVYVRRVFEKHLFSLPELNLTAARARAAIRRDLVAVENELAVALGRVLDAPLPSLGDIRAYRPGFVHNVNGLVGAARRDLAKSVGQGAAIEAACVLAIRLLSAKLWVLWVGVSAVVDYALEKADDPVGDIEREIRLTLYDIAETCEAAVDKEMTAVLQQRMMDWRCIAMEELK